MIKTVILSVIFFCIGLLSYCQNTEYKILMQEARRAYNEQEYEIALTNIEEAKKKIKTPPPSLIALELLANFSIIKQDPLKDFQRIEKTKMTAHRFLKNPNSKLVSDYSEIQIEYDYMLNNYPDNQVAFQLRREEQKKQAIERQKLIEKQKAEEDLRLKKEAEENFKRLEAKRKQQIADSIQDEKNKVWQAEVNRLAEIQRLNDLKEIRRKDSLAKTTPDKAVSKKMSTGKKLAPFTSIGFQSGEIAKYGLLLEHGGRKALGFNLSFRTSMTDEQDIFNGTVVKNKMQAELGPNIKISNRIYLNISGGYGFYSYLNKNDYSNTQSIEKEGYVVTSGGLMLRVTKLVNINGGVSFMNIHEDIYRPEITFGISFNVRGNRQ